MDGVRDSEAASGTEDDTAAAPLESGAESAEEEVGGEHGLSVVWTHFYYLDGI